MYSGKTLLITGGTGSFGNAVLDRFLQTDIKETHLRAAPTDPTWCWNERKTRAVPPLVNDRRHIPWRSICVRKMDHRERLRQTGHSRPAR